MLKEYKDVIISDIKNTIDNRKYFNAEYKNLVKRQEIEYKISDSWDITRYKEADYTFDEFMKLGDNHYVRRFMTERFKLLDTWSDASYHIIYKDGTEACFDDEDILTERIKGIKFTNISYMHEINSYVEIDTDTGELNYDVSIDEEMEARQEYFDNIERKYNTAWGLKHPITA